MLLGASWWSILSTINRVTTWLTQKALCVMRTNFDKPLLNDEIRKLRNSTVYGADLIRNQYLRMCMRSLHILRSQLNQGRLTFNTSGVMTRPKKLLLIKAERAWSAPVIFENDLGGRLLVANICRIMKFSPNAFSWHIPQKIRMYSIHRVLLLYLSKLMFTFPMALLVTRSRQKLFTSVPVW